MTISVPFPAQGLSILHKLYSIFLYNIHDFYTGILYLGSVKVARSLSITLDDGQRLNLSLKEAQTLYTELEKILGERIKEKNGRTGKDKAAGNNRQSIPGMSESKKQKILAHLDKRMTDTPRTLTNLLKGISYSPNHLPLLRELVNAQDKVGIKTKGKRTLYFRKSHKSRSPLATEVKAAAA